MVQNIKITNIVLRYFRIHRELSISVKSNNIIIIGKNGSGKTSILEAISMMSPGKGFLYNTLQDIVHIDQDNHREMQCNIDIETDSDFRFSMNITQNGQKYDKKVMINDKKISKQVDLLKWCHVIWFTYGLQYGIIYSTTDRRKFFDRITFYLFDNHAHTINTYDQLIHERLQLLKHNSCDPRILDTLEWQISNSSIPMLKNRRSMINLINKISNDIQSFNTSIQLNIISNIEYDLDDEDISSYIQKTLRKNRELDKSSERTNFNLHKCNFTISVNGSNIETLSSGEQKMGMISTLLCISSAISNIYNRNPIILFDEIFSFLDQSNSKEIISHFSNVSSQIWMANASLEVKLPEGVHIVNI